MKKMMTLLSMIALAFVGTMIIGCSNKEYDIEQPEQPVGSRNAITLTTTISLPDTDTKALDIDYGNKILSKTFAVGEKVALIYRTPEETSDKVIYTLTEGDITNGGKTATLTFTVSEPVYTENLTYVYPAVITGGKYKASVDYTRLNAQDGTLASIASDLDLAMYTGPWDGENLPSANLTNELALIAYTLKNEDGTSDLTSSITGMSISDGTNNYTVNRAAAAGPIYVAIRPTSGATINYTATDGTYYYTKSVTGKTYEAGQFYQLGLRMKQSSAVGHGLFFSTVGEVVGDDGLAYPATAQGNLPAGVTAVGMVAYKDGKSGLVIALVDDGTNSWSGAQTTAAAHTPVVAGHAWKLPSLDDWNNIKTGNGGTWTGLNTALVSAGGTGVVGEDNKYWSSDRSSQGVSGFGYWYEKMLTGGTMFPWYTDDSSETYYVRACFYFGYDPLAFSVSPTTQVTFASGNLTRNGDTWQFLNNSWEYDGNGRGSQYFTWTEVFNNYNYSTVSSIKDEIATSLGSTSWRGLSVEEWRYLMGYDANCNPRVQSSRRAVDWHRYAVVVDYSQQQYGSRYLLLFPDGFKESDWNTSTMGTKPTVFEQNGTQSISYTAANFSAMQAAGIVILPPAGEWYSGSWTYGSVWTQYYQGEDGLYWSSTCADATGAMSLEFFSAAVDMEWNNKSKTSLPVRLVKNK